MINFGYIYGLKLQADKEWNAAKSLEKNSTDTKKIAKAYDDAFKAYEEIYQLLQKQDLSNILQAKPNSRQQLNIIKLYHMYVACACAHYAMGKYEIAATLFRKAHELPSMFKELFDKNAKEIDSKRLDAIKYHEGLAIYHKIVDTPHRRIRKKELTYIVDIFINKLVQMNEKEKSSRSALKLFQRLMKCKQFLSKARISYRSEMDKQLLKVGFFGVFSAREIRSLILTDNVNLGSYSEVLAYLVSKLGEDQDLLSFLVKPLCPAPVQQKETPALLFQHLKPSETRANIAPLSLPRPSYAWIDDEIEKLDQLAADKYENMWSGFDNNEGNSFRI